MQIRIGIASELNLKDTPRTIASRRRSDQDLKWFQLPKVLMYANRHDNRGLQYLGHSTAYMICRVYGG